jgi:hypothetical protein
MTTKRLPDSLKEANEVILSNITDDTYIPLFTKSGSTEVMKKIKANVLNNGGGGSSTPAAQPDRVIIIDSTLENNIEGKAYKTFAEAKRYMDESLESGDNKYFQVELPAGEFNEQIIISNKYFVHGNKTILTTIIDTEISIDVEDPDFSTYGNSSCIDNCIIEGSYKISESLTTIKIYPLDNCIIKSTTAITDGIDNLIMLKAVNCEVRATKPENVNNSHVYFNAYKSLIYDIFCADAAMVECVIANANVIGTLQASQCQFLNINYLVDDPEAVVKSHDFDINDSNIRGTRFKFEESVNNNHFYNTNGGIKVTMHGDSSKAFKLSFTNCNLNIFNIIQDSTKDGGYFETLTLENSICSFNNAICDTLQVILYNSTFNLGGNSTVNNISVDSFSTLSTDSSATILSNLYGCCDAKYYISNSTTISGTDYRPNRYMYSSDGGQTMHDTKEVGDTHIGIIREPQFVYHSQYPVSTTSYIWIPLS